MNLSTFYLHVQDVSSQEQISMDEALERVRALGYEGLDLAYLGREACGSTEDMIRKAHSHGFRVSEFFVNGDFSRHFSEEEMRECIDFVASSGTDTIQINPGIIHPEDDPQEALKKLVAAERAYVDYAVSRQVKVNLEDFDNRYAPANCLKGVMHYLDRIPDLGFTFDTGNFFLAEENSLDAFDSVKERIRFVHLKDRLLSSDRPEEKTGETISGKAMYACPVGSGVIDICGCIAKLKKIGYDGWVSLEHFGSKHQLEYLMQSIRFAKENW